MLGVPSLAPVASVQDRVRLLQRDLIQRSRSLLRLDQCFRTAYFPVLQQYDRPFRVESLRESDAGFVAEPSARQLTFNSESFAMFQQPIDEMERDGSLTAELAQVARHISIEQYVLHEIPHLGAQGLMHFKDIEPLKCVAGRQAIAEFDVVADAFAARIGARLEMLRAEERGWTCFASRLCQQQYVTGEFAFKAFKSPPTKPHKRQRFLGVSMGAAITRNALWGNRPPRRRLGELPIGTPLMPYFDTDGLLVIFAFVPEKKLWLRPRSVNPDLLLSTCADLDDVPFSISVDRAARLLEQYGGLLPPGWPILR